MLIIAGSSGLATWLVGLYQADYRVLSLIIRGKSSRFVKKQDSLSSLLETAAITSLR